MILMIQSYINDNFPRLVEEVCVKRKAGQSVITLNRNKQCNKNIKQYKSISFSYPCSKMTTLNKKMNSHCMNPS